MPNPSTQGRIIFHVDMDAFFASVEVAENPLLAGKELIIGGLPGQRGVVSTCSYEARRYGVHSAMSLHEANRRCPQAVFMPGNYSLYRLYSEYIMQIFFACTPYVEVVSIDEAYLDVSTVVKQYGGTQTLANLLKEIILKHTRLTCSVGIASNKMMAKIASSACKPNGLLEIHEGEEASFLAPLPIGTIPGIGKKTSLSLEADGFQQIYQLQEAGLERLLKLYGHWGYSCYLAAQGIDDRAVHWEDSPPKSIGAEITFDENKEEFNSIRDDMIALCQKVCKRLRKHKMRARGLSIKLRNAAFQTITRSVTFGSHLNDEHEITLAAMRLLEKHYLQQLPLRLVGVSLEKLTDNYWQPTFWD